MTHLEQYRAKGLGGYIRETWQNERIDPPAAADGQVWQWLNRVDVAWRVALALVPDTRLLLVAASAMARTLIAFVGEPILETIQAIPLACYGLEIGRWRASLVDLNREVLRRQLLGPVVSGPGAEGRREMSWQDEAYACAHHLNQAATLFQNGAPPDLIREDLRAGIAHAWQGWRRKLQTVDGMAREPAKAMANQLLLVELRRCINPGLFHSVFLWGRQS